MRCLRSFRAAALVGLLCSCESASDVAWEGAEALTATADIGAAPMFAVAADGREAVAWVVDVSTSGRGGLFVRVDSAPPTRVVDPLGPITPHGEAPPKLAWATDGALHVLYVLQRELPGAEWPVAALREARSTDGGRTWDAPVTVTDDTLVFGSHNFHAFHASADGALIAAWLDGRSGTSAAYLARSLDGGTSWLRNLALSPREACPCCRTAIASRPSGRVWIAWREVLPGNLRDVVVARSTDGGATFSPPERVHADDWVFDACPHAGPALVADAGDRVHVAWWTGKEGRAGVWYARSDDGVRFGPPVSLDDEAGTRASHVQLAVDGEIVVATWDRTEGGVPAVMMRVSRDGGRRFGAVQRVSTAARSAGFPTVALANGSVSLAWTESAGADAAHGEHGAPAVAVPSVVMLRRGRID
jgi:hypothetical protein